MSNITAGIHILVRNNNKYLLIKRNGNDQYDPSCWDLPGGGINYKEEPFDTAIRETKEETNLDIRIDKILTTWGLSYDDMWSIELIVLGTTLSEEIILSEEHTEYKWVDKNELISVKPRSIHLEKLIERGIDFI